MKNTSLLLCLLAACLVPSLAQAKPGGKGKKLDTNGDGVVTYAEAEGAERFLEHFDSIDANGNGEVTREEMKAHHQQRRETQKAKVKAADTDGNKAISYDEASTAGLDRLVENFDRLDSNGDGEVSRDEMKDARKNRKGPRSEDG